MLFTPGSSRMWSSCELIPPVINEVAEVIMFGTHTYHTSTTGRVCPLGGGAARRPAPRRRLLLPVESYECIAQSK